LERIIVCAKKIVYKPPEFNYHFALLRSLLVAVLRHIREVHENAPIREAEDYQRRKRVKSTHRRIQIFQSSEKGQSTREIASCNTKYNESRLVKRSSHPIQN
jgi:hypothetical protein